MRFEFLDHTADLMFRAYGKTINKAFENAALAFFETACNTKLVKPLEKKEITVQAQDLKSLLYDFLEELLVLHEAEHYLFSKFKVKIDEKNFTLTATLWGEKIRKGHEYETL